MSSYFSSNECPKTKLSVSGLKDPFFVKWTRTSLCPISISRRVDKNKLSLIKTKYDFPFLLIQQQKSQVKGLKNTKNHCPAILVNICITSSLFKHLSVHIYWVRYCLKIVHSNISIIYLWYVSWSCYIILCLSSPCKQKKKKKFWLNVNANTGTRIISLPIDIIQYNNPAEYFLR